jgi:hypothetical protein
VPKPNDCRTFVAARMVLRQKTIKALVSNSLATIKSVGEPQLCEKL